MAKRANVDIRRKKSRSRKTKKRLEAKRLMLAAKIAGRRRKWQDEKKGFSRKSASDSVR